MGKGICAPCQWFKESPLKRWPFAVFLLFGILAIIWILIRATGSLTGDILSGLCAFILACYGANHFRILLGLKEQVDKFAKNNARFKRENAAIKQEVNKLSKAQQELGATADRLKETTTSYQENISKFKALDDKLGKLADDNIAGLEKLQEMSKTVQDSIQKELIQHQRDILMRVQETMEFGDDTDGLNEDEYNRFIAYLPIGFQNRFKEMEAEFVDIAGDDGVLDLDEFTKICDEFAVEEAKMNM